MKKVLLWMAALAIIGAVLLGTVKLADALNEIADWEFDNL